MSIIYKTLFEVKILHEFYLTEPMGKTIFDFEKQTDRLDFLADRNEKGKTSVSNDISVSIPVSFQSVMKNNRLRVLETYSGFKVAIEVKSEKLKDGTTLFKPVTEPLDDLNLVFLLNNKNAAINSISNIRMQKEIPSAFYFSNENVLSIRKYPFLSETIPDFNHSSVYEQGELASFGKNDIREFYRDLNIEQWRNIKSEGFVNEHDRLIVPRKFHYSFDSDVRVTEAEFVLKDKSGTTIKRLEINKSNSLDRVLVDFDLQEINTFPQVTNHDQFIYSLEVSGDNGYFKRHDLIFMDDLPDAVNSWGILHFKTITKNKDFSLLDDEGYLKTRLNSDGTLSDVPVFEIRIKSRLVYWRYINNKRKKLKLNEEVEIFLNGENGALITRTPLRLSHDLLLFKNKIDKTYHYLPNPSLNQIITIDKHRHLVNIFVPDSTMFPPEINI